MPTRQRRKSRESVREELDRQTRRWTKNGEFRHEAFGGVHEEYIKWQYLFLQFLRPKPTRRKRIKAAGTDTDSDEDVDNSQGSPGKTGRKNIRKVLRDKQVAEDTKQAAKDEEERLRRIAERQKLVSSKK